MHFLKEAKSQQKILSQIFLRAFFPFKSISHKVHSQKHSQERILMICKDAYTILSEKARYKTLPTAWSHSTKKTQVTKRVVGC